MVACDVDGQCSEADRACEPIKVQNQSSPGAIAGDASIPLQAPRFEAAPIISADHFRRSFPPIASVNDVLPPLRSIAERKTSPGNRRPS
jgi:hypothetical protein